MALFHGRVERWPLLILLHLGAVGLVLWLRRLSRTSRVWKAAHDWYPLLLYPLFFKEVEVLASSFGDWSLTEVVQSFEEKVFNGQPSLFLSERWNSIFLSEYLHFCYFAFIFMVPAVAGYWYAKGRRTAFHHLILLVSTVFFGSYVFFMLFPVDSPFYLYEPLPPPLSGQFFYEIVHHVSSRGGARGGAFPSAHVSGAVVVLLVAWRYERRLACFLLPIVTGIILATDGRFHYVMDVAGGLTVALAAVLIVHARLPKPAS